jgi:hypothetical protein
VDFNQTKIFVVAVNSLLRNLQKQTDETEVLRISNVQEPEQENLSILYYPFDLDEENFV